MFLKLKKRRRKLLTETDNQHSAATVKDASQRRGVSTVMGEQHETAHTTLSDKGD